MFDKLHARSVAKFEITMSFILIATTHMTPEMNNLSYPTSYRIPYVVQQINSALIAGYKYPQTARAALAPLR